MKRALTSLLVLLCCALVACAAAQNDAQSPEPYVVKGAATADRLWVLMTDGSVIEYDRSDGSRHPLAESSIYDIQRRDGRLLGLRHFGSGSDRYELVDLTEGGALLAGFNAPSAPLLLDTGGEPALLSREALLRFENDGWQHSGLALRLRGWPGTNARTGDGTTVYIGYNLGEWGGGLQGIEVATGRVFDVKGLDKDLDPVTGVARDPSHPDCIIASVGLMHMIASGKILRVCGERATVIFEKAVPPPTDPTVMALPNEWPFFDVVDHGEYWTAVSFNHLVSGRASALLEMDMPAVSSWHGLNLAFVGTKLIVLYSQTNRHHSLSGSTPLLIPVRD